MEEAIPDGPTVLLIDSDPDILKLMEYAFETEGIEIIPCTEATEALRHVADGKVDCAVVDLHHARTPECLGFLNAVRSLPMGRDLPVLVTSTTLHAETLEQALALGARKVIPKPFYPSEVLREVRAAVGHPAA